VRPGWAVLLDGSLGAAWELAIVLACATAGSRQIEPGGWGVFICKSF